MSTRRVIVCDGPCGRQLTWEGRPTLALMEGQARAKGWHAPDRLGKHWCLDCRSEAGAIQWWRRENVRLGLDAGYGLGRCTCATKWAGRTADDFCSSAGHPGVVGRLWGRRRNA